MFTITLCYPSGYWGKETQETVQSSFIPQIGMEITGSSMRFGRYQVAEVSGSVDGPVLSDHVYVILKESES